ncbi:MAG: prephenate dehydratase [Balneolales bacterium]|nr:prephenate dehydratase [Balneolales bacterium]
MSKKRDLKSIREELDRIDQSLLRALSDRHQLIQETAAFKKDSKEAVRHPDREHEILNRIGHMARSNGVDRYFAMSLFRQIIDYSVRFQTDYLIDLENARNRETLLKVGYQGTDGAYSQQAVFSHFSAKPNEIASIGFETFREVVEAVDSGELDYGMLPIENTTAGSINDTYDLLHKHSVFIVGEEVVRVNHCLVAMRDVPLGNIKRVFSHPQAIAQCSEYLSRLHHTKVETFLDTAMAAKKVLEDADLSQAAIASERAAELYGLKIIARNIANQKNNFTRFVVISRNEISCDSNITTKTSIIMSAAHRKGALAHCLNILQNYDLNLTKLESRPQPGTPWEYLFYIDFEGNLASPQVQEALEKLKEFSGMLKVLGSYPSRIS